MYQQGIQTIQVAKDFWIFIAVAVPLTALTLGIWFMATYKEKRAKVRAAELEEKAVAFDDA